MSKINKSDPSVTAVECQYLCTKGAAKWLNCSTQFLEGLRCRPNEGPPFSRLTTRRVRYKKSDLDSWMENKRQQQNSK